MGTCESRAPAPRGASGQAEQNRGAPHSPEATVSKTNQPKNHQLFQITKGTKEPETITGRQSPGGRAAPRPPLSLSGNLGPDSKVAQGHTAREQHSWDSHPGLWGPGPALSPGATERSLCICPTARVTSALLEWGWGMQALWLGTPGPTGSWRGRPARSAPLAPTGEGREHISRPPAAPGADRSPPPGGAASWGTRTFTQTPLCRQAGCGRSGGRGAPAAGGGGRGSLWLP